MSLDPPLPDGRERLTQRRSRHGSVLQMQTDDRPGMRVRLAVLAVMLLIAACGGASGGSRSGADAGSIGVPVDPAPDGGTIVAPVDPGPEFQRTEGWSVRRRMRSPSGNDVTLEEQLTSFAVGPGASRIRRIDAPDVLPWTAPAGLFIEDAALHRSGAVSAVLVDGDFGIWMARLSPRLELLDLQRLSDPDIAHDPFPVGETGTPPPTDVTANGLPRDSVQVAPDGEEAVLAVVTPLDSVLLYRLAFTTRWESPRRALVLPVSPHAAFLPIGGSFDTFGAMWSSYRTLVDVDADGNAYLAFWVFPKMIQQHDAFVGDGLRPISANRFSRDSDVLLEKFDRAGHRLWSRVIGTENEDEPYSVRAVDGAVAVVGRSRRVPGEDNTFWDAFISVSSADGTLRGSRTFQLEASSILLSVAGLPGGGWLAGGSEGWSQNPEGLSIFGFGSKLLLELPSLDAEPVRIPLPAGPRHNEIRSVLADSGRGRWFAGHEDGPVMHTGDADPSAIHATGVLGFIQR